MREGRRWWREASVGSTVGLVLTLASCGPAATTAPPDDTGSAAPSSGASPVAIASASQPTSSVAIKCERPEAMFGPGQALPGERVPVQLIGFPANAQVALDFHSETDGVHRGPMGDATVNERGEAEIFVVIPPDAPYGYGVLTVRAGKKCSSQALLLLASDGQSMAIDDETVRPGQRVTLTAIGFQPRFAVSLHLDCDPQEVECPQVASIPTSPVDGSVHIVVEIPPDITPGEHFWLLNGIWVDGVGDLGLVAHFTVE
jgi:hypothetical protein